VYCKIAVRATFTAEWDVYINVVGTQGVLGGGGAEANEAVDLW